ncbi:hypothetical protein PR002_g8531 [Phytophthora rubi]|uniref:Uncharacterized protein n=1 Tax=Phytophthora rubi TaxID=129364 RepID=A0A6A3MQP2_9STRA|nr:hypothetical protein PR002_g8531 [Phytophthora rubi]
MVFGMNIIVISSYIWIFRAIGEVSSKPTNTLMIGQKHQLTNSDWTKACTCFNVRTYTVGLIINI